MAKKKGISSDQEGAAAAEMTSGEEFAAELETLRKQLEGEKARAEENLAHWQRAQADFVNYKRRVEQEKSDLGRFANAVMASRLLSVLDDFDRAEATLPATLRHLSWLEGVLMIHLKLNAFLQQEGVQAIEALDKPFDPQLHEAVVVDPEVALDQGYVVEEMQRGYRMHDRLLRPALVRVGKQPADADNTAVGAVNEAAATGEAS